MSNQPNNELYAILDIRAKIEGHRFAQCENCKHFIGDYNKQNWCMKQQGIHVKRACKHHVPAPKTR